NIIQGRKVEVGMPERKDPLRVDTDGVTIKILTEPFVINTTRGYAPAVNVTVEDSGEERTMFIGAKSLSDPLQRMVESNGGRFSDLRLKLKKQSEDRYAGYLVEQVKD
ncbi:MAG: hypothetical protein ACE5JA_03985, partial [bacterium]